MTGKRAEAFRTHMGLIGQAQDLLTLWTLLKTNHELAHNVAESIAAHQTQALRAKLSVYPFINVGAVPSATDIAPAKYASVIASLPVGAAVLLFVAVDEFLMFLVAELPKRFRSEILKKCETKQVEFGRLETESIHAIRDQQVADWLTELEKKSLLTRVKTLYSFIRPPRRTSMPEIQEFERLVAIRNESAHESQAAPSAAELEKLLDRFRISMLLLSQWVWDTVDNNYRMFDLAKMRELGLIDKAADSV